MNTILHERQLLEMYCTLCYALFDVKRRTVTLSNSGVPYPLKMTAAGDIEWIDVTGVPLGSFPGIEYDECIVPYAKGDVFLFYSDGVSEAMNASGDEFGRDNIAEVVQSRRGAHCARDRRRHLRGRRGLPRRRAAERRHHRCRRTRAVMPVRWRSRAVLLSRGLLRRQASAAQSLRSPTN